jgi:prevent-host-death family protein
MRIIDIDDAKANLLGLVNSAHAGKSFVIAENGKPLVVVISYAEVELSSKRRIGFMEGDISVPDDFDSLGTPEIEDLFQNNNPKHDI